MNTKKPASVSVRLNCCKFVTNGPARCVIVVVCLFTVAAFASEVTTERPRMLLRAADVDALRAKCRGPGNEMFLAMKRRADSMLHVRAKLDNQGRFYLPTYAAMYLITRDERYASKAKEWFNLLADQTIKNPWLCLEFLPTAACAYDWIYPTLTSREKVRFADGMIRQVTRIKKLWRHSDYNNHFLLEHMSEVHVGLTLAHEPHHQNVWRKYLSEGEKWLKEHVIPAMNEMADNDGGDAEGFSYANWGVERPLALYLLAWRTATGEDLFPRCKFLRWAARWNIYGRKPDGRQCRSEDCPSSHRWSQGTVKATFAICAAAYRDPYAQWAHDLVPFKYPQLIWRHLIPWDTTVPARPPIDLPLAAVFRGIGHVYTRSAWLKPDATWAAFQCGPIFAGHQHLDNNSFVIYKLGSLAIDSGVNEYSSHRANYYSRTIAHNTILVYDPDETFPSAVWSSQGTGGSNDGGQRRVAFPTRATAPPEKKAAREVGHIVAFINRPQYCYACGDASKSYSPKKLKGFTRQFVHVRPDTFVVFDRVVSTSPNYPKTWLLHSINKPQFPATGPTFRIQHRYGQLDVWTLLPKDADVRAVGGPGKEFWVDGKNYPPRQKSDPEAGAWRVEVRPKRARTSDYFLHVLVASDVRKHTPTPTVKLLEASGRVVTVQIVDANGKATVSFAAAGATGGQIRIERNGIVVVDEKFPASVVVGKRK